MQPTTKILSPLLIATLAWLFGTISRTSEQDKSGKPNIVFIMTDDQDYELGSLSYMPHLQNEIIAHGTLYSRHYCTVSICCPSRVSLWTGQTAHNTNVTDVRPPYGGYPKFVSQGLNDAWLPVWLQELGYATYYVGKLFNAHNVTNFRDPRPRGWNGSDFLLDPFTYEYFHARMTRNAGDPVAYDGQYSVDVVAEKAYGFLDEAADSGKPFFLGIAPIAPHATMRSDQWGTMTIPEYAERHKDLFKDYKLPRTKNFNPDVPSGVGWVRELPQLNNTVIDYHDEFARARLRSLQAVDETIQEVVRRLEAKGIIDNTYIFFTSDNGYHIGQHRLPPGKECAFEEDIHIPLAIRGPGVPKGHIADIVSSHTDLTPTILKLAGSERPDLDGLPLPLTTVELDLPESSEHVNVEFWGHAIPEGTYSQTGVDMNKNTYKALRVVGPSGKYSLLYTVQCTGEREFYDMLRDPSQMHNLLGEDGSQSAETYELAGHPLQRVLSRIDALLMVMKSCKADTCRWPWKVLHPSGGVRSLVDALDARFDQFYDEQPKVSFSSCQQGYIKDEEGPQNVKVFGVD